MKTITAISLALLLQACSPTLFLSQNRWTYGDQTPAAVAACESHDGLKTAVVNHPQEQVDIVCNDGTITYHKMVKVYL